MNPKIFQKILDKAVDNKKIFGTSFCINRPGENWSGASGNLTKESQFFIASTTKLFVTALILELESQIKLNLEDKISKHLSQELLTGLHILKGKDFSQQITIKNLLAHTSGLPDYFQQKDKLGNSLEKELMAGKDQFWNFNTILQRSKNMQPLFAPDSPGKAHYSDTNFQLLGKIIENITGRSINENFILKIIQPLNLSKTYLYSDPSDQVPKAFYYKNKELWIPRAMTSFGPDGGIVATASELMIFLKAFFGGKFFPASKIESLKTWNKIFFPLKSGIGLHCFRLPWLMNPTGAVPELIGHSGLSGTLAYFAPKKNLFITGTVNQVAWPSLSFQLAIKLIQKVGK